MTLIRGSLCRNNPLLRRGKRTPTIPNGILCPKTARARLPPSVFFYSSTPASLDDDDGGTSASNSANTDGHPAPFSSTTNRSAALEYNQRRASYKRTVGKLRAGYREEHRKHEARDLAERDAAVAATTRGRLERQRAKNERSFRNAVRQEELRRQAGASREDRLRLRKEIRDRDEVLHQRARNVLLSELEEESKSWLTTREEVEAAFGDPSNEQLLWARPQGVLGVANPSLDSHFWTYEGHTWDRSKTYKTRAEVLLEELEKRAYDETNVDSGSVWTGEAVREAEARERKARLRATVRQAGRRALLQKQKDYLATEQETPEGEPPGPLPIPSLGVLGNTRAQEKEGAGLLLKDPTRFFVFGGGTNTNSDSDTNNSDDNSTDRDGASSYSGASLGVPVALRDPLRTGQPQGRVFPVPVGKLPKPDLRTEKEKKRQEREERLWAAAGKAAPGGDENDESEMLLAEEDREIGEAVDYEEAHANWDSDDEEWERGLDEDLDADLLAVPRELRYRDEDLERVIHDLESKARTMQSHVRNTIKTMEQEERSRIADGSEDDGGGESDTGAASDAAASEAPFFDAETTENLESVGADVGKYERLMASLTREQLLAMFGLEAREQHQQQQQQQQARPSGSAGDDEDGASSSVASTRVFEEIPGLSEEQIEGLTELESFIKVAEQSSAP